MPSQRVTFVSAADDGDGADFIIASEEGFVTCYGTFDSATCVLQYSPDDGTTYITATDAAGAAVSFTAAGTATVKLPAGTYRGSISGSVTAASLTLQLDTMD